MPETTGPDLPMTPDAGEVVHYDNSPLTLYDMERYGVDMCLLKPSMQGTTNEYQADLVRKYPDKFRAFCADQTTKLKIARGEATWSLDAAAQEVEDALKTGMFIGIGEFIPMDWDPKKMYTFEERLGEYRVFMELAEKYGVTVDFHDFTMPYYWDPYQLLARISREYPEVPIVLCHGGYSIGGYIQGAPLIRKALAVASGRNIYLETGNWPAEYYLYALKDPNTLISQSHLGRRLWARAAVHSREPGRRSVELHHRDALLAEGADLPGRLVGMGASSDRQAARLHHAGRDQPDPRRQCREALEPACAARPHVHERPPGPLGHSLARIGSRSRQDRHMDTAQVQEGLVQMSGVTNG